MDLTKVDKVILYNHPTETAHKDQVSSNDKLLYTSNRKKQTLTVADQVNTQKLAIKFSKTLNKYI
jgi:predicted metallo-beta-lactamase superfamily hydrolase